VTHANIHIQWPSIEGSPIPLGVTYIANEQAYNFALYSKTANEVTLVLFTKDDVSKPSLEVRLEPPWHKTKRIWHCRIKEADLNGAVYYAYRVDGPASFDPLGLSAFDPDKILLDPFAKGVYFPPQFRREAAKAKGDNTGKAPLGLLFRDHAPFDWSDDRSPRHYSDAIVYEIHIKGFTASETSGLKESQRGTFAGVIERIPYLKELGVTIVELMPVHQFDTQEGDYWGYMTLNFFSPHQSYASNSLNAVTEFRQMVKALHAADIEVILDVVYNHTTEGDHLGPVYSFKGIDNASFYLLTGDPNRPYANYSGTGNTLNCTDPCIRNLILDSLRYWVTEMHVDGFRFDLASILTRSSDGSIDWNDPPLLSAIRTDPVLSGVRLIAEPWDAGGAYQLGTSFPGMYWHQWNGMFRDDIRRFVRGDAGTVPSVMRRLYGSDDLFPDRIEEARRPFYSINYVVSHDGFTLYDLVSYNERHNEANGHANTDGAQNNFSWNCGWEGDNGAPANVIALRKQQAKNFFCLLMLANGMPMFAAGDEFLHTQGGNSNPYNQDNPTTWLDWSRLNKHADIFRFVKLLIAFRKAHPTICRSVFWRDDIRWRGVNSATDLSFHSHTLAYYLSGASVQDADLYVMINGFAEPLSFTICDGYRKPWMRVVDTSLASPDDICIPGNEVQVQQSKYTVQARSIAVLMQ
jgi:glycogen operon protein